MEMDLVRLEYEALIWAAQAHGSIDQVRKYTNEPYILHPISVVKTIKQYALSFTPEQIAAAYLHDVLEDTPRSRDELFFEFGQDVCSLVEQVTDVSKPSDGNRKVRKQLDLEHLAKASPEAMTIKLADLIDNTSSIIQHDKSFARVYLEEKKALLEVLRNGDPVLFEVATRMVRNGQELLRCLEK